jgi:hypothetical protein
MVQPNGGSPSSPMAAVHPAQWRHSIQPNGVHFS